MGTKQLISARLAPLAAAGLVVGVLVAGVLVAGGCGEDEVREYTDTGVVAWAVERRVGPGVDPGRVVARVDGEPITVGDVALCTEMHPARGLEGCLESLVDVAAVSGYVEDADREAPQVEDARLSALAAAYLREHVVRAPLPDPVSEDEVDAFLVDRASRLIFERPEVRRSSHLLISENRGPSPRARALAERVWAETDWSTIGSSHALERLGASLRREARETGLAVRVERDQLFQPFSNPPAFGGIGGAVQPFADALFAIEAPGQYSGLVDSEYGTHIIRLEAIFPPLRLESEAARSIARRELEQRARANQVAELMRSLQPRHETLWWTDNFAFLGAGDEDLLRQQSAGFREAVQR